MPSIMRNLQTFLNKLSAIKEKSNAKTKTIIYCNTYAVGTLGGLFPSPSSPYVYSLFFITEPFKHFTADNIFSSVLLGDLYNFAQSQLKPNLKVPLPSFLLEHYLSTPLLILRKHQFAAVFKCFRILSEFYHIIYWRLRRCSILEMQ